jgi:hypothetical protein
VRYGLGAHGLRAVTPPDESPAATATSARPPRVDSSRWHLAACWRALESVAGELGDPPRAARYAALAGARQDLPSPPTLRAQLGPWSGIAAALVEQRAAQSRREPAPQAPSPADRHAPVHGRRTTGESVGEGRLATQVEVAALRHLAEHPGSSGTEVKRGAGIRSSSQTWALLARLEREGLLVNESRGSAEKAYRNAWRLSAWGEAVLEGLPEGMYAVS